MQTHNWPPALQTASNTHRDSQGGLTAAIDRGRSGQLDSQATPTHCVLGPDVRMKTLVSPTDQCWPHGPHTSSQTNCFDPKTQKSFDPLTRR